MGTLVQGECSERWQGDSMCSGYHSSVALSWQSLRLCSVPLHLCHVYAVCPCLALTLSHNDALYMSPYINAQWHLWCGDGEEDSIEALCHPCTIPEP